MLQILGWGLKAADSGDARDSNGCFLWAFAVKLIPSSVVKAELWAVL